MCFRNKTLDRVCVGGCEAMGHGKKFYYFLETVLVSQFGRWVGSKRGYPQRLQNRIESQPVTVSGAVYRVALKFEPPNRATDDFSSPGTLPLGFTLNKMMVMTKWHFKRVFIKCFSV